MLPECSPAIRDAKSALTTQANASDRSLIQTIEAVLVCVEALLDRQHRL